jgi:acetyl-CoA carboxylase carboxyltransferase component
MSCRRQAARPEHSCSQVSAQNAGREPGAPGSNPPRDTRRKLIQALDTLENKRDKNPPKKHVNMPL